MNVPTVHDIYSAISQPQSAGDSPSLVPREDSSLAVTAAGCGGRTRNRSAPSSPEQGEDERAVSGCSHGGDGLPRASDLARKGPRDAGHIRRVVFPFSFLSVNASSRLNF